MANEFRLMDIDDLPLLDSRVTRQSNAEAQRLAGVTGEFGQLLPVVFNEQLGKIVFGYEIVEAVKASGGASVLVHVVSLGPTEHTALSLALTAPYWKVDKDAMADRVQWLAREGYDVDNTGLTPLTISKALGEYDAPQRTPRTCPQCGAVLDASHAENHLVAV
jgi:hypothetical protein